MITKEQVTETFVNLVLEEHYNFLEEDLVKLAEAFVKTATQTIIQEERKQCVKVVRSLNTFVADKLQEIRDNA
jgi:hypothetical protein